MPRFFTETINESKGIISGDDAKHIAKVLRMHAGEKLVACDCQGYDYDCVIESLSDKEVELSVDVAQASKPEIVTTEEELEGFYIVKSILREVFPAERVTYRDAVSYFAIFADDNNRRPICRLNFNRAQKKIGFITEDKKEEWLPIANLDEIYQYRERIREAALKYL